jgi:hypothetical protein
MTAINWNPACDHAEGANSELSSVSGCERILKLVANRVGSVSRDTWETPVLIRSTVGIFYMLTNKFPLQDKQRGAFLGMDRIYCIEPMSDWLKPELEAVPKSAM